MMNEGLLGPAEKHVIKEFKDVVRAATKSARELVNELEKIDTESEFIDEMMLDSKGKETLIATLPALQNLSRNLDQSILLPTVISIILAKRT